MPEAPARQKSDEMIQRILETAAELFASQGFAGARMDEIARRAGVNKAMLYYYVGDKEALYEQVLHEALVHNRFVIQKATAEAETWEGKLRALIAAIAGLATNNPNLPRLMLREVAGGGTGISDAVEADMAAIFAMLGEILREGTASGTFRPCNPLLIHMMIIGSVMVMTAARPVATRIGARAGLPDAAPLDTPNGMARHIADTILTGLLIPEASQ